MPLSTVRLRRGTAATWTAQNPILAIGEPGWETDTLKGKVGDGSTTWNSLPYSLGDSGAIVTAAAPSGGDDLAYLQALLTLLGAGGGGTLQLRPGTYLISNLMEVPNKVTLRGVNRSATLIKAGTGFPTSTALIRLGPAAGLSFASRLERMSLDCNNVTGSVGVYSFQGQEMCGLMLVAISNFKATGIHFDTGAANFTIDNVEVYPSSTGATTGILLHCAGSQIINKPTVGVQGLLTVGISVATGEATIIGAHIENCTDGILFDNARGVVIGASGPTAVANVTNLIRGTGNTRYLTIIDATKNSATNTYKADFFGITVTDAFVQTAVAGNLQVARFQHNGDQIGFYGTTPIAKAAAISAPPAAAPAGGTGTAAGGWDTAANRDAAIATINGLRTAFADMKARLVAYGLLP